MFFEFALVVFNVTLLTMAASLLFTFLYSAKIKVLHSVTLTVNRGQKRVQIFEDCSSLSSSGIPLPVFSMVANGD